MNIFDEWCARAVSQIRYRPDKDTVYRELKAHMEDHYDALIDKGFSSEEARKMALDAMGSAEIIAPQLGNIHRPYLGYLYSVTKFLAIAACSWALFLLVAFTWSHFHSVFSTANYKSLQEEGRGGFYSHPNVSDSSDGYRFKITEAAVNTDGDTLYLELQTAYWPWMQEPEISNWFWAADSNGRYYASRAEAQYADIPRITIGGGFYSQGFTSQNLQITHFDSTAEWVELHYDRDGRSIVLRVTLVGGEDE